MEKEQHRRHRPAYLAPTAVHLQHFSSKSYDSGEYFGNEIYNDDNLIEYLRIPLFIEIPQDEVVRFPITSPPCSNGSDANTLFSTLASRTQHHPVQSLSIEQLQKESSFLRRSFREFSCKVISSVFVVFADFLLLILVCLIGLFFHVEVQVVNQRAHGRRGRVVVQQSSRAETQQRYYQSTDLLRPLQQSSPSSTFLMSDDMV